MELRGPDGEGEWWSKDGCVGIGHRRLAINNPENGKQPIVTGPNDQNVCAVNGEFYGLDHLSGSDSFAFPSLVEKLGFHKSLEHLRGEFALLLYDQNEKCLWVARDRFGIKPLFWARHNEEIWFASKASALWAAGIPPAWCEPSFHIAATTQYPPLGDSLFRGIQSLKPAHFLSLKRGELKETRYWDIPPNGGAGGGGLKTKEFLSVLRESVQSRVPKDREFGVLLSGGVDSSSILALASETRLPMKAYTVDFEHAAYSEAHLARKQTQTLGLEHRVLTLSSKTILSNFPTAVQSSEGLAVNGHLVAKKMLAKAVKDDGIKVLLTGEGADELLFGYRHFRAYFQRDVQTDSDPAGLGILVSNNGMSTLDNSVPHFFHTKIYLGQKIACFLSFDPNPKQIFETSLAQSQRAGVRSPLEMSRDAWVDSALCSYILEVLGDGTEMTYSVEGRPPFLDHKLWEACSQIQAESLQGRKAILREAVKGLVPEYVRTRPKHPFMANPLGSDLIENLRSRVNNSSHPFVDTKRANTQLSYIEKLSPTNRLEWEPAMLWLLSSYYLQDLWS